MVSGCIVFQLGSYRADVQPTYLELARGRPNLTIRRVFAKSIVLDQFRSSTVARGVVLVDPFTQVEETVEAGLVISCANVYGSPTLLMRSGVGPGMVINLPTVGKNYQNQPLALLAVVHDSNIHPQFGYPVPVTLNKDYNDLGRATAMLAFNIADPIFAASSPSWGAAVKQELKGWRRAHAIGVFPVHGSSRGQVTLDSSKPNSAAISLPISPADQQLIQADVQEAIRIVSKVNDLGAGVKVVAAIPNAGVLWASRGVGTCAMGTDPSTSVVDTNLMVRGISNLMVCDGSVMPSQTQSPHMPISAIACKIADSFIRPTL